MPAKTFITDAQLSDLALDAAIELELDDRNKLSEGSAVKKFLDTIKGKVNQDNCATTTDQSLFPVYAYALDKTNDAGFTPHDSILKTLYETILKLEEEEENKNGHDMLTRFCLGMHEALVSNLMGRRISVVRQDDRIR